MINPTLAETECIVCVMVYERLRCDGVFGCLIDRCRECSEMRHWLKIPRIRSILAGIGRSCASERRSVSQRRIPLLKHCRHRGRLRPNSMSLTQRKNSYLLSCYHMYSLLRDSVSRGHVAGSRILLPRLCIRVLQDALGLEPPTGFFESPCLNAAGC